MDRKCRWVTVSARLGCLHPWALATEIGTANAHTAVLQTKSDPIIEFKLTVPCQSRKKTLWPGFSWQQCSCCCKTPQKGLHPAWDILRAFSVQLFPWGSLSSPILWLDLRCPETKIQGLILSCNQNTIYRALYKTEAWSISHSSFEVMEVVSFRCYVKVIWGIKVVLCGLECQELVLLLLKNNNLLVSENSFSHLTAMCWNE